jgi:hypothetical protein
LSATLLLTVAEVGDELRIGRSEVYELLKLHPELVVELPATRGKRVSRQRLAQFVERLNPMAEENA